MRPQSGDTGSSHSGRAGCMRSQSGLLLGKREWEFGTAEELAISDFSPIEARVRDQDLNTGDQQGNERNYRDPVRYPHQHSMPG